MIFPPKIKWLQMRTKTSTASESNYCPGAGDGLLLVIFLLSSLIYEWGNDSNEPLPLVAFQSEIFVQIQNSLQIFQGSIFLYIFRGQIE